MDRAKVIEGLKHCGNKRDCLGCPYRTTNATHCDQEMMADALALLDTPPAPAEDSRVVLRAQVAATLMAGRTGWDRHDAISEADALIELAAKGGQRG